MNAKDGNVRMSTKAEWFARLMEDPEDAMKSEKIWYWNCLTGKEWVRFLSSHPQYADEWCDWWKLDRHDWTNLLCAQPQFAEKCDWDALNGGDWVKLLDSHSQFAEKCDWDALNGGDWVKLLDSHPQFAEKCDWNWLDEDDHREILKACPQLAKVLQMAPRGRWQLIGGVTFVYSDCVYWFYQGSDIAQQDGMAIKSASIVDASFSGSLAVPDVLGGGQVTCIDERAFAGWSELKSVVIPEGVKEIRNDAFAGCASLKSVVIPEGVEKIGDSAFADCANLSHVVLPSSVRHIGSNAFSGTALVRNATTGVAICDGWVVGSDDRCPAKLDLPKGTRGIADGAFEGRVRLGSVTIPEGVTKIPYCAFQGCTNLQSVVIPEGVTSIGYWAFAECQSLSFLTIPASFTDFLYNAFVGCTALKTIVFEGLPPEVEWEEFQDGAIGYYRPEYAAEWERHICKDGTWEGWFETKCTSELSKQV